MPAQCGEDSLLTSNSLESACSGKLGRRLRRGVVGKVLLDSNSLATYPTWSPLRQVELAACHKVSCLVRVRCLRSGAGFKPLKPSVRAFFPVPIAKNALFCILCLRNTSTYPSTLYHMQNYWDVQDNFLDSFDNQGHDEHGYAESITQ